MAARVGAAAALPRVTPWLFRGFGRHVTRDLRKSFNAVRVLGGAPALPRLPAADVPVVVFLNHPSWWDPMVCVWLASQHYAERTHFGPIDADAMARYPLFSRLGFFGVRRGSPAAARQFLQVAGALCARPATMLWITPHGAFCDASVRPVQLESGLGHLAARIARAGGRAQLWPLAVDYRFWQERRPELCMAFGQPLDLAPAAARLSGHAWTERCAGALTATLEQLHGPVLARDAAALPPVVVGRAGGHPVYEAARRVRGWLGGPRYRARHAEGS